MQKRRHPLNPAGWLRRAQSRAKTPLVDRALNLLLRKKKKEEAAVSPKPRFVATSGPGARDFRRPVPHQ